jgi:hypothetical protein
LLHRQADNVAIRALNGCDDFRAVTLSGVGAGFIERIYFRQIFRDGASVEFVKVDPGYFLKTVRLPAAEAANKNRGPNFM